MVGVLALGTVLRVALRKSEVLTFANRLMWFALALALLMLFAWVPFIGALLGAVAVLAGLGGGALEWYRRRRPAVPVTGSVSPG